MGGRPASSVSANPILEKQLVARNEHTGSSQNTVNQAVDLTNFLQLADNFCAASDTFQLMKTIRNSIGQPFVRLGNVSKVFLCTAALVALATPAARASDPNGIYAFVDRVVFEPSEAAPERLQVWGGFALAKTGDRDNYQNAERGHMYFKLRSGDEAVCKKEWADLKSVAGTRQIVAFGSRSAEPQPKLRKPDAKVENPDAYPKSWGGITKIRMRDYAPINQLAKLMDKPAKESPKAKTMPPPRKSSLAMAARRTGN